VQLPEGAQLTHSLIDGAPTRPAVQTGNAAKPVEQLLFPLRQSERIGQGRERFHTVQRGETLSNIANAFYADPAAWGGILDNNRDQLDDSLNLFPGQRLRIPAQKGATFDESSFVIELAYKRVRPAMGELGRRALTLPTIDVDTVKVVWHLYLPEAYVPLAFAANLTQYSRIRYDPFRRVLQFLERARFISSAWAGGGRYKSILTQRKSIYAAESRRRQGGQAVLSNFPLVGERYRFKRLLPGADRPAITVTYMDRSIVTPLRWLALLASFALTLVLLYDGRRRSSLIAVLIGFALLLVMAYFVLGVHRRLLWGADLALLLAWTRLRAGPLLRHGWSQLRDPWTWAGELTLRNLFFLLGLCFVVGAILSFPLLLSSISLLVLSYAWWAARRRSGEEVRHA